MPVPNPTPIYRLLHVENLPLCLKWEALLAPAHAPNDGMAYKTIHNVDIQNKRTNTRIPCGPDGVIHDYVPFYFGPRSPMLYQLHTGRVAGYREGQEPLIYLVANAQAVQQSGVGYVFSDGHGIAAFTNWFHDLTELDKVDWEAAYARVWKDTVDDPDRQRRKQSEFLIHRECPWALIEEVAVLTEALKQRIEGVLAGVAMKLRKPVRLRPEWYY